MESSKQGYHLIPILNERAKSALSNIQFLDRQGSYRHYSYQNLWLDIVHVSDLLKEADVKNGEVVAIILPTQEEFLMSFFGCQYIHAIPFSFASPTALTDINDWFNSIANTLSELNCATIITDDRCAKILNKLNTDSEIHIINLSKYASNFSKNKSGSELAAILNLPFDANSYSENEISFLQLSSGTTGRPKAVMITHKNVITNTNVIASSLPLEKENVAIVCWLPLYHDMGLVGCLLLSIVNGTPLLLFNPHDFLVNPFLWLKAMHDFRATITTAPNFAYGLVRKRVPQSQIQNLDLSCLKGTLCGAENVSAETAKNFIEHMKPAQYPAESFLPVYGLAEASLAVSFTGPKKELQILKLNSDLLENGIVSLDENGIEICSVGRILPTFELKIVNSAGKSLSQGQVGQIHIKGPCVTSGYFRNKKLNSELLSSDGWLKTGDEGFLFHDELYICGRLKDIIIVNGKNHYPVLYEEKLSSIADIRKGKALVSSIKLPEFDSDQIVVLAESTSKAIDAQKKLNLESEIAKVIQKAGLPLYKVEVLPPGTLRKTSSGKIQRRLNIQLWKDGRLSKAASTNSFTNILTFLTRRISNDKRTNI
tara:strand:+ start:12305 stop:14095 length:1791 start_codon:yes stop_codon:yes gene_type:complete